jgi:hypothetical protein
VSSGALSVGALASVWGHSTRYSRSLDTGVQLLFVVPKWVRVRTGHMCWQTWDAWCRLTGSLHAATAASWLTCDPVVWRRILVYWLAPVLHRLLQPMPFLLPEDVSLHMSLHCHSTAYRSHCSHHKGASPGGLLIRLISACPEVPWCLPDLHGTHTQQINYHPQGDESS